MGKNVAEGCKVGKGGVYILQRTGVEEFLPLLHLGPQTPSEHLLELFRGAFNHTVDAKNRLTIPKRFRPAFAGSVVLVRSIDMSPCIGIWRPDDFEAYSRAAIDQQPPLSTKRIQLERFFYANAQDAEIDAAGRVIIPAGFSESAQIQKDVVVLGAGTRLEVWSPDTWNDQQGALLESIAGITADADAAA